MIESNATIDLKHTGSKLKNLAEKNGYRVKDIQEYLGLACPQSIYRWYNGIVLPSIDNLLRLSELFNMHMEELLVTNHEKCLFLFDKISSDYTDFRQRIITYAATLA